MVVEAVAVQQGRCEFLAVANPPPQADADPSMPADEAEAAGAATEILISARQLPLPYALPAARA